MASKTERVAIANKLFPHILQSLIQVTGDSTSITSLALLVGQGYQADRGFQPTAYDIIAKYLDRYHFVPGKQATTKEVIETVYWSKSLQLSASKSHPFVESPQWRADHIAKQRNVDLSFQPVLLPHVISVWAQLIAGLPGSPISKVGLLSRRVTQDGGAGFDAHLYDVPALSKENQTLWLLYDEILAAQPDSRPWSALVPPDSVTPILDPTTGLAGAIKQVSHKKPEFAPSLRGPFIHDHKASHQQAGVQRMFGTTFGAGIQQLPTRILPTNEIQISMAQNDQSIVFTAQSASQEAQVYANRPAASQYTSGELRAVKSAPRSNRDLPWDLLVDCTLEELLIYYPEHVFNWPGLAVLYNHYVHRMVGDQFDYTNAARRVAASRGTNDAGSLKNKVRQWIKFAGNELTTKNDYDPEEKDHYQSLYEMVRQSNSINVSDFLHRAMRQPPGKVTNLLPPLGLAEVGKKVQYGHHPSGKFADRVKAAMDADRLGLPEPDFRPTLQQPSSTQYHPLISTLADSTCNLADRLTEEVAAYNKQFKKSDCSLCVRPMSRFHTRNWRRRRDVNNNVDENDQIWEWISDHQTVIEYLEENFTREQIITQYWRDLEGDTFLWLQMEYPITKIIDMLPIAALAEFKALPIDGEVEIFKTSCKGKTASKYRLNGAMRKRKELALVDRIKHNQDGTTWDFRAKERNLLGHPPNKILYDAEKSRFDGWTEKMGFGSKKRKRGIDIEDESSNQKRKAKSNDGITNAGAHPSMSPPMSTQLTTRPIDTTQTPLTFLPLDLYHTNDFLFTYPHGANGPSIAVAQRSLAQGSVPQWWRDERYSLLSSRGIAFDKTVLETYFDQGHDILPDRYNPSSWESWPGEFSYCPNTFPAPIPIENHEFSPTEDLPFDIFSGLDGLLVQDTTSEIPPYCEPSTYVPGAEGMAVPQDIFGDATFHTTLKAQPHGLLARVDLPVVISSTQQIDTTSMSPLPSFDLTREQLEGEIIDTTSRNHLTGADHSISTKYFNYDSEFGIRQIPTLPQSGVPYPPQPLRTSAHMRGLVPQRALPRRSERIKSKSPSKSSTRSEGSLGSLFGDTEMDPGSGSPPGDVLPLRRSPRNKSLRGG